MGNRINTTLLAGEKKTRPGYGVTLLQPVKHIVPSTFCQTYTDQCCEICPICQSCSLDLLPKKALERRVHISKLRNQSQMDLPGVTFMSQQHGSRGSTCLNKPWAGSPRPHSSHGIGPIHQKHCPKYMSNSIENGCHKVSPK